MTGMMIFWVILMVVAVAVALLSKVYFWLISALSFACALGLAWYGYGVLYQLSAAVVLSGLGLYLWVKLTPPAHVRHRDAVESRLSEAAALSQHGPLSTFSTFMHEPEEVMVEQWIDRDTAEVIFRNKVWKARLAPGGKARAGLYRVLQIKGGKLLLEEIKD